MTPVISPWLFYLMSVVDKIQILSIAATIVLGIAFIAKLMDYYLEKDSLFVKEEKVKATANTLKKLAFGIVTSSLVFTITPSQNTITKMIIAQNVTYERVEVATDTVETVYNDIMALFEDKGETE